MAEALKPLKKLSRSSKNRFVTVNFDAPADQASVEEALNGRFSSTCVAQGDRSFTFQVDGHLLLSIVERSALDAAFEIGVEPGSITVQGPKARSTIPRVDRFGCAGVTTPIAKPIRGHAGKVVVPLEGRQVAPPKGDTWDFSAQVPFKAKAGEPGDRS
jgi:hypothetical protein